MYVLQDKSLHRLGHLTLGVLITCGLGLSTCLALFVNKGVLGSWMSFILHRVDIVLAHSTLVLMSHLNVYVPLSDEKRKWSFRAVISIPNYYAFLSSAMQCRIMDMRIKYYLFGIWLLINLNEDCVKSI